MSPALRGSADLEVTTTTSTPSMSAIIAGWDAAGSMEPFEHLLMLAADDPDILAVFLGGGRGKGVATLSSDWDCDVVVLDGSKQRVESRLAELLGRPEIDGGVVELAEFIAYAEIGTPEEWDRYAFAHSSVPLDKTDGLVTRIVREKGRLPATARAGVARTELDAYINAAYRSLKNAGDGLALSSRLDAAESIPALVTFLFALSGRVRPYNKFLEWELINHPLVDLPFTRAEFLNAIGVVLTSGDVSAQKRLFAAVQDIATAHGLSDVFEAWGDGLALLRS